MTSIERRHLGGLLETLWDDKGEFGQCVRENVTEEDIRDLLRKAPVRFVEVNVGKPLHWIPLDKRFKFWNLIRPNLHVVEKPYLEDYPGSFFYDAEEWVGRDRECLIVLHISH